MCNEKHNDTKLSLVFCVNLFILYICKKKRVLSQIPKTVYDYVCVENISIQKRMKVERIKKEKESLLYTTYVVSIPVYCSVIRQRYR